MAIATTYAHNPVLDDIIKEALERCGFLRAGDTPEPDDRNKAVRMLNTNLKAWQVADRLLRHQEYTTVTLTAGTAAYTLASDTLEVEDMAYVRVTSSGTDYPVRSINSTEYSMLSKKDDQGVPSRMLVELKDTPTLTLYRVPDSTVSTLTIRRHRIVRDITSGTTADLYQRFIRALILELAADWAESVNMTRAKVDALTLKAQQARDLVSQDSEGGYFQARLR